jgi:hypothetical protein
MNRRILYFAAALLLSGLITTAQTTPQAPQAAAPKATVEGTVTRANSGQPLKGATVTLLRANTTGQNPLANLAGNAELQNRLGALISNLGGGAVAVNTDANGRFVITGVDAGDYRISAQREGFIRSEFGQRTPTGTGVTVKLTAGQLFNANIPMTPGSVISGRVITPDGDPALNAPVQAYTYQYANGERTLAQVANAETNDLGEYRLFGLEPGEYFVSVTSRELADQTPVGTVDAAPRPGTGRGGRGGARGGGLVGIGGDAQGLQTLATLAEGIGPLLQGVGGGTGNPPVYYPGTLDPDGATPIPVAAAAEVRSVDFNLRPSRTATVSGRVSASFPLNAPAANAGTRGDLIQNLAQQFLLGPTSVQVNLTREGTARSRRNGLLGLRLGSTPVNADGTFEIKGVAPGQYNLTATARDPNGQEHSARTRVDVASADVGNVVVALRAGTDVRGKVVADAPPQQFKMTSVRVSLVAEDGAAGGARGLAAAVAGAAGGGGGGRGGLLAQVLGGEGQLATEAVAEDGSFTLKNAGALEYRVRVTGLPQGAYIVSGRLGTKDALNGPFTVDDASAGLQLQLGFTPGRVTGVVADTRGTAAPGAQVVLVPDEARRGRNDAYFSTNSDQNGQFTLNNVPPGSYKLFAWEDIPAGAYQYPDFIRRYEDRGQSITVNPNGTISANARLIPAS